MSKQDNLHDFLTDIADAVRSKTGKSEPINAQNLSEEIRSIEGGDNGWNGSVVYADGKDDCFGTQDCKEIVVREGVTRISKFALYQANLLEKITLPSSLKYIEDYSFSGSSLKRIDNINNVISISNNAFSSRSLQYISIPEKLETLGSNVFQSCSNLISVLYFPNTLSLIVASTFAGCSKVPAFIFHERNEVIRLDNVNAFSGTTGKIVVPDNLYDEWIAATNWSAYADRIVKASEYQPNNE